MPRMKNCLVGWLIVSVLLCLAACSVDQQAGVSDAGRDDFILFKAGEAGYVSFRIPAIAITPKGTILTFCEARRYSKSDWADIDILMRRSTDGGNTWEPSVTLVDGSGDFEVNPVSLQQNLATEGEGTQLGWELFQNIHGLSGLAVGPFVGQGVPDIVFDKLQGALAVILIDGIVVAALLGSRRERFLVWWYFVAIAPFLVLVPYLIIGRYLYLALVGLAILAGVGVARLVELIPQHQLWSFARPGIATAFLVGVAVWFGVLGTDHQDWLTAKGEEAETYLTELKATHPTVPEGGRIIVQEHPRSLSFELNDMFMLEPAVRLIYGMDIEVVTPQQLKRGEEPPERAADVWFPLRATGSR